MVTIDPFRAADFATLAAFAAAIQEHERLGTPGLRAEAEIGRAHAARLVAEADRRDGVILFARDGDMAVGFVAAWVAPDDDPLVADDARADALVSDLYVVAPRRREGIARRLLAAVESTMRARGCRRMHLCSKATNAAALASYAALGYRPYEVILHKPLDGGAAGGESG